MDKLDVVFILFIYYMSFLFGYVYGRYDEPLQKDNRKQEGRNQVYTDLEK